MKTALFVALSLLALVSLATAAPSTFVGGSFFQASGRVANDFAIFDVDSNEWSPNSVNRLSSGLINSMAAAGDGVFAVGTFTAVGNSPSTGVAYWDGRKWCPIRQHLSSGSGSAVVCDSATSCWVAGEFTAIVNVDPLSAPVVNFAHFVFNAASSEWEFDLDQTRWNNATVGNTLPDGIVIDKLDYVGSGANLFFFVTVASSNTIYRGGAADNGWFVFAAATNEPGTIRDWSIEPSRGTLYAVVSAGDNALQSITGSPLTSACTPAPCAGSITATTDWADVITGGYNGTFFNSFDLVHATASARLLIGLYDPDSGETNFAARYRVLSQSGASLPTLVGDAFEVGTSNLFERILTTEAGDALVTGTFDGANLFYPADPLTTDADGVVSDRRSLDRVSGLAVFNSTLNRWVQWAAGGTGGSGGFRLAYNSNTRQWHVASSFSYVYNLHADGAIYHDDDSALTDPFFPVLTRYLQTRPIGSGEVWEIICETSACSAVFIGGDFAFHGPDTFGAVVRAVVKRSGEPELSAVGGGLWNSDDAGYLEDEAFQLSNGQVYALSIIDGFLYAGGAFSRSAPGAGFVCLSNIARIDASALTGNWENLGGGCDDEVYDITEWSGRLYAAGRFRKCSDAIVNYVASFTFGDETPAWESLHTGVDATAYSLEAFQGRLIVGGDFTHAGGLPVSGVASWDGFKWRALLPACSGDCTPGNLQFYFNVVNSPSSVHDLQRDRSGRYLFATGVYEGGARYLSRWEYTEGDFGTWLVKGELDYSGNDGKGHNVAIFTNDKLLVSGDANNDPFDDVNDELGVWDQDAENSNVTPTLPGASVRVVRGPAGGNAGSASSLSSPLSSLLAFVF